MMTLVMASETSAIRSCSGSRTSLSRLTADGDETWMKVPDIFTERSGDSATTSNSRETSVPGAGCGAMTVMRHDAVPPGIASSVGGANANRIAASASVAVIRTRSGDFDFVLSTTTI